MLLIGNYSHPSPTETSNELSINWMSWEDAMLANAGHKKKLLIDVYTDWSTWCKVMDRETFADSLIIDYINQHFYAIKLNAEQKDSIEWNDHIFKWLPSELNGVHELAQALCDEEMSYPTIVFLTENHERIRISRGFKDAKALYPELVFVAEEHYLKNTEKP